MKWILPESNPKSKLPFEELEDKTLRSSLDDTALREKMFSLLGFSKPDIATQDRETLDKRVVEWFKYFHYLQKMSKGRDTGEEFMSSKDLNTSRTKGE